MGLGIGLSLLLQSLFYTLVGLQITLVFNTVLIIVLFFFLFYDYLVWAPDLVKERYAELLKVKKPPCH